MTPAGPEQVGGSSPDEAARPADQAPALRGLLQARLGDREVRAAQALEQRGRWAEAADAYRRAIARDSAHADRHAGLARVLQQLERREEAAQAYRQALALDDRPAEWHFQLGAVLHGARRWDEAAAAYRDALVRDGGNAQWHSRLGDVLARQELWRQAAAAYREAVAGDGSRPAWHARLGHALVQKGAWQEAVDALETALQGEPGGQGGQGGQGRAGWWLDLGRAQEGLQQYDLARTAYTHALERDPDTTDLDRQLLAARTRYLPARRQVTAFLAAHLDEVRELAAADSVVEPGPPRVWVYWGQGWAAAPAIVRRCHEELVAAHAPGEVVALDDGLVPYWVTIPPQLRKRTAERPAAYADVLRLELLARYGGVWVDATCLVRGPLPQRLPELMPQGFFAFRYSEAHISNWLLASEPGGYVVTLLRAALATYWRHHRTLIHYFVFHHLFEALYLLDEGLRTRWDATPTLLSDAPHQLQHAQLEPYDPQRLAELLDASFVHKLTHKVPAGDVSPDSLLSAVVRGRRPG